MVFYPVELNLTGYDVLVVGGGPVAARKVAGLVQAGARVRVASIGYVPELRHHDGIVLQEGAYSAALIGSARLVFACTDDAALNQRISADARAAGAWCNVVDAPESSDFAVPAVLRRGQLTVSVATGGAAPALAAAIRDRLESQFEPEFGMLVEDLKQARAIIRREIDRPQLRQEILATLAGDHCVELLRSGGPAAWRSWMEQVLRGAGCRFSGFAGSDSPEDEL